MSSDVEVAVSGGEEGGEETGFAPLDWALLATAAGVWGSSFLFIEIGLDAFSPSLVTWLRLVFGALAVACAPAARRPLPRAAWARTAVVGLVWMAVPLLLFPIAQQHIDSALAGMLNGAVPLTTALVAAVLARRLPRGVTALGLGVGFVGVLAVSAPALRIASGSAFGVGLVLGAVLLYGLALNLVAPLQRAHGSLAVLLRAQVVAVVVTTPFGVLGLGGSTFSWPSLLAVLALGSLGTGLAFVAMTTLVGRVGATAGSVTIYFTPVVAIALGIVVRDEQVALVSVLGAALVVSGAWITSRRRTRPAG